MCLHHYFECHSGTIIFGNRCDMYEHYFDGHNISSHYITDLIISFMYFTQGWICACCVLFLCLLWFIVNIHKNPKMMKQIFSQEMQCNIQQLGKCLYGHSHTHNICSWLINIYAWLYTYWSSTKIIYCDDDPDYGIGMWRPLQPLSHLSPPLD